MPPPRTQNPPTVAAVEGSEVLSGEDRLGTQNTRKAVTPSDRRRDRVGLHSAIRRLLIGHAANTRPGTHAGNVYRTAACTWVRVSDVAVVRPADRDSYHYKGLTTCGSVWVCPLCASKIQERRRTEVAQAIAFADARGDDMLMVSYTFPHRVDQPLALLLRLQQAAIKKLRESRAYVAAMLSIGNAGRIRSLEVTHGQNGWHPHTHELLFHRSEADPVHLRTVLAIQWLRACKSVGLFQPDRDDELSFLARSVDVRIGGDGVGQYLAKLDDQGKWGLSHEVTKSSSKQGRNAGRHPFALASEKGTRHLFLEYVDAMKGQRQLVWSRGLKAAVGIEEKTDEELAQEDTARTVDRIEIPLPAWRIVLGNDARFEVVQAAQEGGYTAVRELLILLGYTEPTEADPCDPTIPAGT